MKLAERLLKVASLVPPSSSIADIGTDHGYIPIYLIQQKKIKKAVAADIHKGPLERAKVHIAEKQLQDKIEVRLGSGLSVINKYEVEGAVIAGMGGQMIQSILEHDNSIARTLRWFVLQPQSHVADLRIWLQKNKYQIEKEVLIQEKHQLYEAIYVVQGEMKEFSFLDAEIGVTKGRYEDLLFKHHLGKLIKKRNLMIQNIAAQSVNEINQVKRYKAVQEKKILEEIYENIRIKHYRNDE